MAGVLKPQMNVPSSSSKDRDASTGRLKSSNEITIQLLDHERDQLTFESDIMKHLQEGMTNLQRL